MPSATQYLGSVGTIIDEANALYAKRASVTHVNALPDTTQIPIGNPHAWMKVPNVICVFADMQGSTKLSATHHENGTARAYQMYTGTAVRIFNDFDPPYIDVRGDGVLALFNSNQPHRALAAAITFKTFAAQEFRPSIERSTGLSVGSHLGIDMRAVLVRKIGLKRRDGRSDRQNEVWAGRPVNMAAKLAGSSQDDELVVSDRFHVRLRNDAALLSCGCPATSGVRAQLWEDRDLTKDERFDFDKAKILRSHWCQTHGKEYCQKLLAADP